MGVDTKKSRYVYQGPYSVGDTAPIPFKYIKAEHIEVYRDSTKLEYNVEYSITGQNVYLMTPIAAVESLVVLRNTKRDQDSEFPQEGKFDSAEVEEAFDKLTMQQQEQDDKLSRAVLLPVDAEIETSELGLPTPEAGKALKWKADLSGLENSKYDVDAVADLANAAKDEATRQANIATAQAADAKSSALFAAQKLTETQQAAQQAQEDIATAKAEATTAITTLKESEVADATSEIQAETMKNIEAIDAAGIEAENKAKLYAQGTIEELPSGSAKYWADVAKEAAQFDTYTKSELDGKLATKQDTLTFGAGLTEAAGDVTVDPDAIEALLETNATFNSKYQKKLKAGTGINLEDDGTISATGQIDAYTKDETNNLLLAKQDKLTAGANIIIDPATNTISATGGGGAVDAYTKAETDLLLNAKQNTLTPGTNISIGADGTISCTLDTYNRSEITGLLALKQNTLTAGTYTTLTNNTVDVDITKIYQVFDAATWAGMSTAAQQAIPLAFVKE